jgi:hypothetical protein
MLSSILTIYLMYEQLEEIKGESKKKDKGVFRNIKSRKDEEYIGQRNQSPSSSWSTMSLKGSN